MSDEPTKTYDELQAEAAARWTDAAHVRTKRMHEIADAIADMPDVKNAPPVGTLWSHPAIVCSDIDCRSLVFTVVRYGCVNGVRDKAQLKCRSCNITKTWNWADMGWMD